MLRHQDAIEYAFETAFNLALDSRADDCLQFVTRELAKMAFAPAAAPLIDQSKVELQRQNESLRKQLAQLHREIDETSDGHTAMPAAATGIVKAEEVLASHEPESPTLAGGAAPAAP